MTNYFRITGYWPEKDISFIMDSNGYYEKLWQFTSTFVQKGVKMLEVGNADKFLDGNIEKIQPNTENVFVRASKVGMPEYTTFTVDGATYQAVKIGDIIYVPDKTKRA